MSVDGLVALTISFAVLLMLLGGYLTESIDRDRMAIVKGSSTSDEDSVVLECSVCGPLCITTSQENDALIARDHLATKHRQKV